MIYLDSFTNIWRFELRLVDVARVLGAKVQQCHDKIMSGATAQAWAQVANIIHGEHWQADVAYHFNVDTKLVFDTVTKPRLASTIKPWH